MLSTRVLLRRGKPRPRAGMFPEKYRRVPNLLKPQQGGQQYYNDFLLANANDALAREAAQQRFGMGGDGDTHVSADVASSLSSAGGSVHARLPQFSVTEAESKSTAEILAEEMRMLQDGDAFIGQRAFNERKWFEEEEVSRRKTAAGTTTTTTTTTAAQSAEKAVPAAAAAIDADSVDAPGLPPRVLGADYFESRFGYSLLKNSEMSGGISDYAQTELWGEMPKYTRDMVFLYLVSRRRNTYAVAYSYEGKRLLTTYTAGNRGLKGGDRGFRGDGSTDNGHQVASMYLNDLLPKIRELRASQGRPVGRTEKVQLVVRVMGFYNGRQGAVRAVQDRSAEFAVRYLEDITPFPLNGPRMPRGVFK